MKKTLSILLSLLMVLSTVTCLFTMPASAEAATTETVVTESLPSNLFSKTTTTTISYDTENQYVHYNIKWSNPDQNNLSYMMQNQYHQLNFEVTASEDLGEGVIAYPVLMSGTSAKADYSMKESVGIRYDVTKDYDVQTVWNYGDQPVASEYEETTNEETGEVTKTEISRTATTYNDATPTLEAGKTYRYTFVFKAPANCIDRVAIRIKGLSDLEAGSVTVSNPYVFNLHNTDWYNFMWDGSTVVRYMVEEDGNVYQRMYGYRAAGEVTDLSTSTRVSNSLNAMVGQSYYDLYFEAGNTYVLNYKLRLATPSSVATPGTMPSQNIYETRTLNYTDAYAGVLNESDNLSLWSQTANEGKQIGYQDGKNPYAYSWNNSTSNSYIRRQNGNPVHFAYTNPETGANIYYTDTNTTSGVARDISNNANVKAASGSWMNAEFSVKAFGQTLQDCSVKANKSNMRYSYNTSTGEWDYNSAVKNYYVPAADNAYVAFAMAYFYKGFVYDFDAFEVSTEVSDAVEYKNPDGETIELPASEAPAVVNQNVITGELTISDHDNTDAFTFEGWYVNGEFAGTDATITVSDTDTVKAVIVYENLLSNAGGFEQYTSASTNIMVPTAKTPSYIKSDGATATITYNTAMPTNDLWATWTHFTPGYANYNLFAATEGINAKDYEPYIISDGTAIAGSLGGDSSWANVTVKTAPFSVQYSSTGSNSNMDSTATAIPHRGNNMLYLMNHSRYAGRRIDGLTVGKTYTVSFYSWSPSTENFLRYAYVTTGMTFLNNLVSTGTTKVIDGVEVNRNLGGISSVNANDVVVQKWTKHEFTFKATDTYAYFVTGLQNGSSNNSGSCIDDLVVKEYDCNGNHLYDDLEDTVCNVCGDTNRVYPTAWDFENGTTENVTVNSGATLEVVDAEGQADKIGDKYLQYTSTGFAGMVFNFMYEQGYKYKVSYDIKVFQYGTSVLDAPANGIDHGFHKYDDGKYGTSGKWDGDATTSNEKLYNAALVPANNLLVTRYWEDGTAYEKVTCFSHSGKGEGNFYGLTFDYSEPAVDANGDPILKTDGTQKTIDHYKPDTMNGGTIWNEWQHFEVEVDYTATDYAGLVEYGIRPNGGGWIVGIDNFKVEKVATSTIEEANNATNGTYAFNIRAKTTDKQQGLRFKSTIDLNKLDLSDGAKIVEYGTLATKASNTTSGYFLRREAADAKNAKIVVGVAYNEADGTDVRYALNEETNVLTYTGVLTGIGIKNYDVDFVVCGYAIVETADGTRITVYDDTVTLSVYDAAVQIVKESTDSSDIAVAQSVIDTYETYMAAN